MNRASNFGEWRKDWMTSTSVYATPRRISRTWRNVAGFASCLGSVLGNSKQQPFTRKDTKQSRGRTKERTKERPRVRLEVAEEFPDLMFKGSWTMHGKTKWRKTWRTLDAA